MSLEDPGPELAPVVLAPGQRPFSLSPVIEDILRTQYAVPDTIFLVEGIELVPLSKSGKWQAIRLLVSDGELCIQGLLSVEMHRFVDIQELTVGCYVRVRKFHVKRHLVSVDERDSRRSQAMLYLVLEDLITIGWNEEFRDMWERVQHNSDQERSLEDFSNKNEEKPGSETPKRDKAKAKAKDKDQDQDQTNHLQMNSGRDRAIRGVGVEDDDQDMEDAFEAFESIVFPAPKKQAPPKSKPKTKLDLASSSKSGAIALPQDWHDHKTPLKLTTLQAIPHLPYKQNWSCNVLAIVTSLSEIEPSHLSPYRQRTARLADPSTLKRVHLTVFLDPDSFQPQIGSAVLLVGVKNHRFDGGSLKKYASDEGKGKWWFENPYDLEWCNVDGIKGWWVDVQDSAANGD